MDGWMDPQQMDEWMNRLVDGWMDVNGWMEMDEWMD